MIPGAYFYRYSTKRWYARTDAGPKPIDPTVFGKIPRDMAHEATLAGELAERFGARAPTVGQGPRK